jgi:short-subunit dehydrogenase
MNKYALITGGSSGIGLELAKLFVQDRYHVILVARNADQLEEAAMVLRNTYGAEVRTLPKDLSNPLAAHDIVQELDRDGIEIDVLVNNAGFGGYGYFWERDLHTDMDMIQVNISTLVQLSRLLLPQMIKRGSGRILNVASTAAFMPGPLMSVYFATKAFVLSISQALAEELRGTGVTVTVLCPGPTRTKFDERANVANTALFNNPSVMSAESVARTGYRALMKGKSTVVAGAGNKLLTFATRFIPRSVAASLARKVQEK